MLAKAELEAWGFEWSVGMRVARQDQNVSAHDAVWGVPAAIIFRGKIMQAYRNRWIVICDFDGTISTVDATDRLLEVYADPEWLSIEQDWKDGEIGSRECLSRQVALLRADIAQIEALADTITIDPHFTSFADLCKRECIELVIISIVVPWIAC